MTHCTWRRIGRLLPLLLASVLAGACSDAPPASPGEPEPAPLERRFGDPYQVVFSRGPAEPDTPPGLAGDTLVVTLGYSGGCADHDFRLRARAVADTTHLWFTHDARGDRCEAFVTEARREPLPEAARGAGVLVLDNPQGGPPFMLRWGR